MSVSHITEPNDKQQRELDYIHAAANMAFGEDHLDSDEAYRRYWTIAYLMSFKVFEYQHGDIEQDFYVIMLRPMEQIHKEMLAQAADWTKTNFYRAMLVFIAGLQGYRHLVDEPSLSLYIRKQDLPPKYDAAKGVYMIRIQGLPR